VGAAVVAVVGGRVVVVGRSVVAVVGGGFVVAVVGGGGGGGLVVAVVGGGGGGGSVVVVVGGPVVGGGGGSVVVVVGGSVVGGGGSVVGGGGGSVVGGVVVVVGSQAGGGAPGSWPGAPGSVSGGQWGFPTGPGSATGAPTTTEAQTASARCRGGAVPPAPLLASTMAPAASSSPSVTSRSAARLDNASPKCPAPGFRRHGVHFSVGGGISSRFAPMQGSCPLFPAQALPGRSFQRVHPPKAPAPTTARTSRMRPALVPPPESPDREGAAL
jgi:hypothetical protein